MIKGTHSNPVFTSLGMFIIDEINFPDLKIDGILGGGGTFAICGSRMVLGSKESDKCAWIIDIGNDCPDEILSELKSWNTGGVFRFDFSRKCTRGWNGYDENEFRSFKYLTPKKRVTITDLKTYSWMLNSKSFHFVCSPNRCTELMEELSAVSETHKDVVIAWEPIPDCCSPEYLDATIKILSQIDILTPNAAECAAFFGEKEPTDKINCERIARKFIDYMSKPGSGIVLRCGKLGSFYIRSEDKAIEWFPAFHEKIEGDQNKVIDPTGCGNTFVGAFATAFVKYDRDYRKSCVYATIASGACIEQYGLPKVSYDSDKNELWNDISVTDRINDYLKRNKITV